MKKIKSRESKSMKKIEEREEGVKDATNIFCPECLSEVRHLLENDVYLCTQCSGRNWRPVGLNKDTK